MNEYGKLYSIVYDRLWGPFSSELAHRLVKYCEEDLSVPSNANVLDICCGTGRISFVFLRYGSRVLGIDKSPDMLCRAKEINSIYVEKGMADFLEGDARCFVLDRPMDLALSVFYSLNHLENKEELSSCFGCVSRNLIDGGYFLFDLHTILGLRYWLGMGFMEDDNLTVFSGAVHLQNMNTIYMQTTGFLETKEGYYQKFKEVIRIVAFELDEVRRLLELHGFHRIYFASTNDFKNRILEPEKERTVLVVAQKSEGG